MNPSNTLFVGKVFKQFAELASTNTYALSLLSKSKPSEGTVISTLHQYAGRGQIGSGWESEANQNITLSIILYPTFLPIRNQFQLNQAISLGVHDFVSSFVKKAITIKWPNDIYIENNKVAGILIQNSLSGNKIQSSIIGIGINVNQIKFLTNPPNPTSFKLAMEQSFDLDVITPFLFKALEARYLQLKSGQIMDLEEEYLQHLYRYKETTLYQKIDGEVFNGTIVGIAKTGKLLIHTGIQVEAFAIKEIRFI